MFSYVGTEVIRIKNELLVILLTQSCYLDFQRRIFNKYADRGILIFWV